ncbi:MAG: RND transporter [Gammaproteobacteria bacterium]|nr:RND transporter [Gammaproteobacteria bacterium]
MNWLDKLALFPLIFIAVFMALAPFGAQSHLLEKLNMLFSGELQRPIDIFDLFLHGTPIILVLLKLKRMIPQKET